MTIHALQNGFVRIKTAQVDARGIPQRALIGAEPKGRLAPGSLPEPEANGSRIAELEAELAATRNDLRRAIAELATAKAAQKAMDEKLKRLGYDPAAGGAAGNGVLSVAVAITCVGSLTARQREILDLVLDGHPSKNIAADLGISQRTVDNHRAAIMRKTGSKSMPALVRTAMSAA